LELNIQITSRDNPHIKQAKAIRDGKDKSRIFIEGVRLSEEALRAELSIEECLFRPVPDPESNLRRVLDEIKGRGIFAFEISERLLRDISDTETPQGIVMIARRPETAFSSALTQALPLVAILHRVSNPSNVGAIVRSAEAAGATGLICTRGTADLMSPKALRASMGSAFRLPAATGVSLPEAIEICRTAGIKTFSTSVRGASKAHSEIDWSVPAALVIGPESVGLLEDEVHLTDQSIYIPMAAPVESLNAAVAAGIILFEASRQRNL
jgi:RNA methyltransferase, TrmH family